MNGNQMFSHFTGSQEVVVTLEIDADDFLGIEKFKC